MNQQNKKGKIRECVGQAKKPKCSVTLQST